jgi:hypothetical protein
MRRHEYIVWIVCRLPTADRKSPTSSGAAAFQLLSLLQAKGTRSQKSCVSIVNRQRDEKASYDTMDGWMHGDGKLSISFCTDLKVELTKLMRAGRHL